jgi:hypothetical protein
MHRSITTAWGMLGLVLVLFTFPWPIAVLSEYLRGLSLSAALPPGGLPGIVLDVLGVLVGAGIAVWSLVARRRKDAIPKLPIFLVLSLGFYLVGLVLTFLVRLFELFT